MCVNVIEGSKRASNRNQLDKVIRHIQRNNLNKTPRITDTTIEKKKTIWRCISYWKLGDFPAMLLFGGGVHFLRFGDKSHGRKDPKLVGGFNPFEKY